MTNQWISLAVIEPLRALTPSTSPIGIDVAMAWFYGPDRMAAVANLCALAGMNWVRDRLNWERWKRNVASSARRTNTILRLALRIAPDFACCR